MQEITYTAVHAPRGVKIVEITAPRVSDLSTLLLSLKDCSVEISLLSSRSHNALSCQRCNADDESNSPWTFAGISSVEFKIGFDISCSF